MRLKDETIWMCLQWLALCGLVSYRYIGNNQAYSITDEGSNSLKRVNSGIKVCVK
jgi:hypothetical protein